MVFSTELFHEEQSPNRNFIIIALQHCIEHCMTAFIETSIYLFIYIYLYNKYIHIYIYRYMCDQEIQRARPVITMMGS